LDFPDESNTNDAYLLRVAGEIDLDEASDLLCVWAAVSIFILVGMICSIIVKRFLAYDSCFFGYLKATIKKTLSFSLKTIIFIASSWIVPKNSSFLVSLRYIWAYWFTELSGSILFSLGKADC